MYDSHGNSFLHHEGTGEQAELKTMTVDFLKHIMETLPTASYTMITSFVAGTNQYQSRTAFMGNLSRIVSLMHELSSVHDEIQGFIVTVCDLLGSRSNLL